MPRFDSLFPLISFSKIWLLCLPYLLSSSHIYILIRSNTDGHHTLSKANLYTRITLQFFTYYVTLQYYQSNTFIEYNSAMVSLG